MVRTRFSAAGALDAGDAHQPGGLIAADVVTCPKSGFTACGRRRPGSCPWALDQDRDHRGVALLPGAGLGVTGGVVGARGHRHSCAAQDGADGLDPEIGAVGVDETHYFLCWRSSSAPKKLRRSFQDLVGALEFPVLPFAS